MSWHWSGHDHKTEWSGPQYEAEGCCITLKGFILYFVIRTVQYPLRNDLETAFYHRHVLLHRIRFLWYINPPFSFTTPSEGHSIHLWKFLWRIHTSILQGMENSTERERERERLGGNDRAGAGCLSVCSCFNNILCADTQAGSEMGTEIEDCSGPGLLPDPLFCLSLSWSIWRPMGYWGVGRGMDDQW